MSSCFNGDWHARQLGSIALVLALLTCGAAQAQSVDAQPYTEGVSTRASTGTTPLRIRHATEGFGQEASETALGGRAAADLAGAVGFVDGQFRISNESRFGTNLGGGVRWFADDFLTGTPRILGVSGWYDGQETILNNYFNQGGVSFESLGEFIDLRLNANIPFEDQKLGDRTIVTDDLNFLGNSLSQATLTPADVSLRVVDFEVAARVLDLNAWIYGGGYQMDGNGISDGGPKGGVRGYITNDLLVDVGVTDDDVFGTNTVFQVTWTPGRTGSGPTSWIHTLADRMREPVYRNAYIATQQTQIEGSIALTDAAGDDIRIVHVDSNAAPGGNGSFEAPLNSLSTIQANSQQGDIILVHANTDYTGQTATLQAEQRFLGEGGGNTHTVFSSELGTVTIPETFAGALNADRPEINNNGATNSVVLTQTAADASTFLATEVSNFDFFGGQSAISTTTGVGAVVINRVAIDGTASHAIALSELTETLANGTNRSRFSPTIDDVTFTNVGGDDIRLDGTTAQTSIVETIAISDIQSDDGAGVGINLIGINRAATIQNFNWDGGTTGDGALRIANSAAAGDVTMSGTNVITGGETATPNLTGYAIALFSNAGDLNVTGTGTTVNDTGGDSVIVQGGAGGMNFTGNIEQSVNAASILSVSGGHTGSLVFTERVSDQGVITATIGDGLQFDNADGTYTFNDKVEFTGTSSAVNVVNGSNGSIVFANGQFTNTTGNTLTFDGGVSNMTFNGKITQNQNVAVLNVLNGHDGTLIFRDLAASPGVISATNGTGLQFNNADGSYTFEDRVDLMGGNAAIDVLAGSDGTFVFSDGNIVNPGAGAAVNIDGSAAVFTYTGNIDATNADAVVLNANTGGSITFTSGTTIDSTFGIDVTNNTGGTYLFAGAVNLTGGAEDGVVITGNTAGSTTFNNIKIDKTTAPGGGDGFVASSAAPGHIVTVTGNANTIATDGAGVALNLNNIIVGASGINFQSVSSDGAASGIILNNVSGGAVNIGSSGAALGASGTIANSTGASAISVNNVSLLNINGLTVDGATGDGIGVTHTGAAQSIVRINNTTITDTTGSGLEYTRSASGLSRLTLVGNQINDNDDTSVLLTINGTGTQDITMNGNNQITNTAGDSAVAITTGGGSKITNILIDGNQFDNNDADATVAVTSSSAGTMNTTVTSNSFTNAGAGTGYAQTSTTGTVRLDLNGNTATTSVNTFEYILTETGGTFTVVDLATVDTRNAGDSADPVSTSAGITDEPNPVPTPTP